MDLAYDTADQSQWLRHLEHRYPFVIRPPEISAPPYLLPVGWRGLVEEACVLVHEQQALGACIVQIKEKFGGLRIRLDNSNSELREAIYTIENRALSTCSECGASCAETLHSLPICAVCAHPPTTSRDSMRSIASHYRRG